MQTAFLDSTAAELPTTEEISTLQTDYENLLKAIIDMLDGARYLWEIEALLNELQFQSNLF